MGLRWLGTSSKPSRPEWRLGSLQKSQQGEEFRDSTTTPTDMQGEDGMTHKRPNHALERDGEAQMRNNNATQLHRQTGGGWGNRQRAEERAREGWGRPNTDHTSRHTRPSTSGYRSYIDSNKPLTSADATRNTETEEEEREKWTTLSTMGGGLDLMEEFKCGICHEMLRRPCLSLNCAHRFCEECISDTK